MDTEETTETKGGTGTDTISWTLLAIDDLVEVYWDVIAPAMRSTGLNPDTDRPTHAWLAANGFRGLVYALREYHDRSFGEFWTDDLGLEQDDAYDWGIEHDTTIELLESFLSSRRDRGNLSESSIDALRYRLATYVRAYAAKNDTENLVAPIKPDSDSSAHTATDAAWSAFDRLDIDMAPRTMRRIHEAVDQWYDHLIRRKRAAFNPVAGLDDEYGWSRRLASGDGPVNPTLNSDHVQQLAAAAIDTTDCLLAVALCAWGLRSSEVAALHRNQFVFDTNDDPVPYLTFTERKNGPGQMSILYGRSVVEDRIEELSERDRWNGYLFPSGRSSTGHISDQTVRNWFDDLADRAGLPDEIDGQKPVPKLARRFWYDRYTATLDAVLEHVGEVAEEQGSASAEVVLQDYLSEERRRQLRREHMRQQLAVAFEDTNLIRSSEER